MPERPDPLRYSYAMTLTAQGQPRKPGDTFRDPTNGKIYRVAPDGSLRRVQVVDGPDGTHRLVPLSRATRARQPRRSSAPDRRG
jgi:hypothetical protein